MQQCGYDCFCCPYPDCILTDEDEIVLTALEIAGSEERDAEAKRLNCEADYDETKRKQEARRREVKRRSYYEHRAEELRKRKLYRETHKAQKNRADRAYYHAHAEEINARRRERRKMKNALRRSLTGQGNSKKE